MSQSHFPGRLTTHSDKIDNEEVLTTKYHSDERLIGINSLTKLVNDSK